MAKETDMSTDVLIGLEAQRFTESALLGSILINPESITEIKRIIKVHNFSDSKFYDNQHARIYEAMLSCELADIVSVAKMMESKGTLRLGDCAYLSGLVADVPDPFEYMSYAKAMIAELPQEEPEFEITEAIMFPDESWVGIFAAYRDLVAGTTEATDAFHYATFCQILGATLGRRLFVYHASRLYPNFYICLVGKTGLTRKDTCWARAKDILERLHDYAGNDENPPFRTVRGLRSYEGLLDELEGYRKVRLIQVGELLSLLAKAKQESLSNIIPQLTELYDCPDRVNPPVHQNVVDCKEPFVSIMAGTTHEWLLKALTDREIYGGFANRWMYFCGIPKDPKPNPPKVDTEKRDEILAEMNTVRAWADDAPHGGEIFISAEAEGLFTEYYCDYYKRCQHEGIIPTLIVRVQDFIWKLALLYAAVDLSEEITLKHLKPAIAAGNYLEANVADVFRTFTLSKGKQSELLILNKLKEKGQPTTKRELYRSLTISAYELEQAVGPLIRTGLVINTQRKINQSKVVTLYELA